MYKMLMENLEEISHHPSILVDEDGKVAHVETRLKLTADEYGTYCCSECPEHQLPKKLEVKCMCHES